MNIIHGYSLVSHHDGEEFSKGLDQGIRGLQEQGMEVEVQYSSCLTEKQVMFSALLLGRKEATFND